MQLALFQLHLQCLRLNVSAKIAYAQKKIIAVVFLNQDADALLKLATAEKIVNVVTTVLVGASVVATNV